MDGSLLSIVLYCAIGSLLSLESYFSNQITGHSFLIQLISNSGDDRMDIFSFLIQGWKGWERIGKDKNGKMEKYARNQ